jgi:hypothetical protein
VSSLQVVVRMRPPDEVDTGEKKPDLTSQSEILSRSRADIGGPQPENVGLLCCHNASLEKQTSLATPAGRKKWILEQSGQQQVVATSGGERSEFQFDHVVGHSASQRELFKGVWKTKYGAKRRRVNGWVYEWQRFVSSVSVNLLLSVVGWEGCIEISLCGCSRREAHRGKHNARLQLFCSGIRSGQPHSNESSRM